MDIQQGVMPFVQCEQLDNNFLQFGFKTFNSSQADVVAKLRTGNNLIIHDHVDTSMSLAILYFISEQLMQTKRVGKATRAVILAPDTTACHELYTLAKQLWARVPLRATLLSHDISISSQHHALRRCNDLIIATPQRLAYFANKRIDLSQLQFVGLHEPRQLLGYRFKRYVPSLLRQFPLVSQKLLFAAHPSMNPMRLKMAYGLNGKFDVIDNRSLDVFAKKQLCYLTQDKEHKKRFLSEYIHQSVKQQALIIAEGCEVCDEISHYLRREGHRTASLHTEKLESQQKRIQNAFEKHERQILVIDNQVTDEIEISLSAQVINFDLPYQVKDYVNRSRFIIFDDNQSKMINLVGPRDLERLDLFEKLLGQKFHREVY